MGVGPQYGISSHLRISPQRRDPQARRAQWAAWRASSRGRGLRAAPSLPSAPTRDVLQAPTILSLSREISPDPTAKGITLEACVSPSPCLLLATVVQILAQQVIMQELNSTVKHSEESPLKGLGAL